MLVPRLNTTVLKQSEAVEKYSKMLVPRLNMMLVPRMNTIQGGEGNTSGRPNPLNLNFNCKKKEKIV
jgi:hypothetical protein